MLKFFVTYTYYSFLGEGYVEIKKEKKNTKLNEWYIYNINPKVI